MIYKGLFVLVLLVLLTLYRSTTSPAAQVSSNQEIPELVIQSGHSGAVTALAIDPTAKLIASASRDGTAKIWDLKSARLLRTLAHSPYWLYSVAFSPDGKLLATGGGDYVVRLWEVATGRQIWAKQADSRSVKVAAFSPDGSKLLAGSLSCTLWDVATAEPLAKVNCGDSRALFLNDHTVLALYPASATGGQSRLTLHDFKTGQVREFQALTEVEDLRLSPNGAFIAAVGREAKLSSADSYSRTYSYVRAMEVRDLPSMDLRFKSAEVSSPRVFAPDDKSRVKVTPEAIEIADVQSGSLIHLGRGRTGEMHTVSLSNDLVASFEKDQTIKIIEAGTGRVISHLAAKSLAVRDVKFSPSGEYLGAVYADGSTKLWNLLRGSLSYSVAGAAGQVHSVAFDAGERLLATAGPDGIRLFDLFGRAGKAVQVSTSGGFNPKEVERLQSREQIEPTGAPSRPRHLQLSLGSEKLPEARSIVASAFSPTTQLMAFGGYQYFVSLWDIDKNAEESVYRDEDGRSRSVNVLSFSPDGNTIAVGDEGGGVRLWHVQQRKAGHKWNVHKSWVNAAVFVPQTDFLATAGADGSIVLANARSGDIQILQKPGAPILSLSASATGTLLASGNADNTIKIWDMRTGSVVKTLTGHSSAVTSVAFSPGGEILASGGDDGVIKFWSMNSFALLVSVVALDNQNWLAFDRDGFFEGTRQAWGLAPFRFASEPMKLYEPEQFFHQFFQPGLIADVLKLKMPIREVLLDEQDPRADLDIRNYRRSLQPRVVIATPRDGTRASSRSIELELELHDAGSGLRDVRVFRNGSLVYFREGVLQEKSGGNTYKMAVPATLTAGMNEFTAYAFNDDNIKSADARVTVLGTDRLKRRRNAYIVAIGIDNYANTDFRLTYPAKDADAFAASMGAALRNQKTQYDKVVPIVLKNPHRAEIVELLAALAGEKEVYLKTLRNPPKAIGNTRKKNGGPLYTVASDATNARAATVRALMKVPAVQPEDAVILYFAGHGMAEGDRYYLLPRDLGYRGKLKDIDSGARRIIANHSLSDKDLERAFQNISAHQLMLVIDACHSGLALESNDRRRGPINARGLGQLAYEKGMYVLAASQSYQAAIEVQKLGGVMTHVLVEQGLKRMAGDRAPNDAKLTAREWFDYTVKQVPVQMNLAVGQLKQQRGELEFNEETWKRQTPVSYYRQTDAEDVWIIRQD
jgi:WD40 repeat protein